MTWRVEHGREESMQSRGRPGKSSQTAQEYKDEVMEARGRGPVVVGSKFRDGPSPLDARELDASLRVLTRLSLLFHHKRT